MDNGGYFDHRGDRWWFWSLYVPRIVPGVDGVAIHSDMADSPDMDENGWNRWVGAVSGSRAVDGHVTSHEWGHLMHMHEGYFALTCSTTECVYFEPIGNIFSIQVCQYHWFETWENTPDHGLNVPHWTYDWWTQ
ncbi:MAG: hypothetical protein JSW61_10965 [Candidatus Thorarchaeota archaeon]|nr:MAG: hypothetical protein JSW61_10965 [Candidatus Thorarchaeota archaeon]